MSDAVAYLKKTLIAVRVEAVHLQNCGGKMEPTNTMLASYPPQYPHRCNKCGYQETYLKTYPDIEYVEGETL